MRKARKAAAKRLYEIAEVQNGFFTTKQAKAAGFAENTHPYHVHAGNWFVSTGEFIGWPAFREANALTWCFGRSGPGIGERPLRKFTAIKLL